MVFFSSVVFGQQDWSYTQYLFNLYDINSAYAGNHQTTSLALRHRSQWMGFEGSPSTQQFSMHSPLAHQRIGAGIRVLQEQIGARTQQMARISGAYKLNMNGKTLSFSLAGGILRQRIDVSKLTAQDVSDMQLINLSATTVTPMLDVAIFYNSKKYYFGVESSRLNRSNYEYSQGSLARLYYNLTAVAGYMKQVGQNNMIQLSALMKFSEGMLWQAEMNLLYLYHNKLWVGGGYRLKCGFQAFTCLNISEHLRIGLSYDLATGPMRNASDGSAELFIGYTLKNRSGKSVRYF